VRAALLAALWAAGIVAAGCGSSGSKEVAPQAWVQRANAVCKRDDRAFRNSPLIDSAASIMGLRREAIDLQRVGFFRRVPAAGVDIELAGPLLARAPADAFGTLRRADRALISARQAAARKGVHCSFATVPLGNL